MEAHDREVAGIRCMSVLEYLGAFVDGDLEETKRLQVEGHLEGCDWCTLFGGEYAGLVKQLRELGTLKPSANHSGGADGSHGEV